METYIKTRSVKIAGRTFDLAFTLNAMLGLQKCIPGFDFNKLTEVISTPEGMLNALHVLAQSGAAVKGETLDIDRDWFANHIPANARRILSIQKTIMDTMADAMLMEAEEDDDHEVDVVLEELEKKREVDSSLGEKSQPTG